MRASRIGFIPQDPLLALNPVFKVGTQLLEAMRWHAPGDAARERIAPRLLVSCSGACRCPIRRGALERYPHQFSGGQRQRLLIAAALACAPAPGDRRRADHGARRHDPAADPAAAARAGGRVRHLAAVRHPRFRRRRRAVRRSLRHLCRPDGRGRRRCGDPRRRRPIPTRARCWPAIPIARPSFVGIPGTVPSPLARPAGCLLRAALRAMCGRLPRRHARRRAGRAAAPTCAACNTP